MINSVVVTIDVPRAGGAAADGRAGGRRTAIGCSGGGVTTGALVGGGVSGGFGAGGVGRAGGVDAGTTTATGVDRGVGGGVRTGVGFGGALVGGGVGLGLVGVGDGLGRHEPSRTSRKSTFSPIPPVGGPVAGITSTRTLAPGEAPIETHTSTLAPGAWLPPVLEPAHATPAGATNKAPAPTTHPHRRARPHALM